MKQVLLLSSFLFILLACNSPEKKSGGGIAGEYKKGMSTTTITDRKGKVGVSICFADETCIEPCFTGLLISAGNKRFSGWVYPETADSASGKQLVVLSFFKNEVDVLFTQKDRNWLGMSCDPGGVYKREE